MIFRKMPMLFLLCTNLLDLPLFAQNDKEESWHTEGGYTQQIAFDRYGKLKKIDLKGIDVRFISPRFEVETDDTHYDEDREKHPENFKKARFCFDFMYAGKYHLDEMQNVREFSLTTDFLYSIYHFKKFTLDAMGGMRLFFITNHDYGLLNFKRIYFWDCGLSAQFDLGFILPFIDIKRGTYYTVGAEFKFKGNDLKPKKHYKAHKRLSR